MLKKAVPYVVLVVAAVGIFYLGMICGLKFFVEIKSTTMLQDSFLRSSESNVALYFLDEGKVDEAHEYLKNLTDSAIFEIDQMSEIADPASFTTACKLLKSIREHRKKHEEKYTTANEFDKKVSDTLDRWESCEP